MKIISKYKDCYDYLTGIYGEDPLLILDRRSFDINRISGSSSYHTKVQLFIGGYVIDGIIPKLTGESRFVFGDAIDAYSKPEICKYTLDYLRDEPKDITLSDIRSIDTGARGLNRSAILIKSLRKDVTNLNLKEDCSIILKCYSDIVKYPILLDINIVPTLSPEIIYKLISDWLSAKRSAMENMTQPLTNKEKIISKGFDLKTSFRTNLK